MKGFGNSLNVAEERRSSSRDEVKPSTTCWRGDDGDLAARAALPPNHMTLLPNWPLPFSPEVSRIVLAA